MNEFFWPTLSAIVGGLVVLAITYLAKRVKEDPERYSEGIIRAFAAAFSAIVLAVILCWSRLVHQALVWSLDWADRVAANPGTAFDEVPDAVGDVLLGASWPWQYTCAAFLLAGPLAAAQMIADGAKRATSARYLRYLVVLGALTALALLLCGVATGLAVGAHVGTDYASAWAYSLEPAYFPGLAEAWSLPWGLHWTTLTGVAAAAAGIQYYGFLVYMKLDSMAP